MKGVQSISNPILIELTKGHYQNTVLGKIYDQSTDSNYEVKNIFNQHGYHNIAGYIGGHYLFVPIAKTNDEHFLSLMFQIRMDEMSQENDHLRIIYGKIPNSVYKSLTEIEFKNIINLLKNK